MSKSTLIGNIISVSGNILSVRMSENVLSTMPIIDGIVYRVGQIGSFVRVPLGYADIFGIVTPIGADAMPESLRGVYASHYALFFWIVGQMENPISQYCDK